MLRSIRCWVAVVALIAPCSEAFAPGSRMLGRPLVADDTALFMAKSRKAKRRQRVEKQGKNRPKFYDAMDDAEGKPVQKDKPIEEGGVATAMKSVTSVDEEEREARAAEARRLMDERPDVSTMIVDEETGIEVVAQGKSVMDVVTRKAVKLSDLGPEYRLAQMFPGVPPAVREEHRFDWTKVEVPQMVKALIDACSVKLEDGKLGIPPHPSVANRGIDFVLANRDYLGYRMKRTLGRLQMRAMSQGKVDEAREYKKLWKHFLTLENHISAPFRQMIMDGEGRVGPNFGNLDIMSYANGDLYERTANYLVLKGMVAHWEKKVRDADYVEKTPQTKANFMTVLARGDCKRYLPDPPILFTLKECTQVCAMAQKMTKLFVETPELYNDLPPEVRFLEESLTIKGGAALRKYMIQDFCPREDITPEALREGMRRLYQQFENMQLDPYGDITNILERLNLAMSVGTDDERDPYQPYLGNLDPNGPGFFQTYTFNHEQMSLVRFFDSAYERENVKADVPSGGVFGGLFNFGAQPEPVAAMDVKLVQDEGEQYKVPKVRANGRPHNLGWLELLDGDDDNDQKLGQVPAGTIIPDSN